MLEPVTVANALLKIAAEKSQLITPQKLLKLVYLSHGWSFAHLEEPLVNKPFKVWEYGVGESSLYQELKKPRNNDPITRTLLEPLLPGSRNTLSAREILLLKAVYDSMEHLSGEELSYMTSEKGTPYYELRSKGAAIGSVIPNALIAAFFCAKKETLAMQKQRDDFSSQLKLNG